MQAGEINGVERARLVKCLASIGMTPADRARILITAPKAEKDDPYNEFSARTGL
jgi:hypothetical protein